MLGVTVVVGDNVGEDVIVQVGGQVGATGTLNVAVSGKSGVSS